MQTPSKLWKKQKWRWLLPVMLVLLLCLFLITLLWLPWQAQRMESNERQEQLIADTLWLEQTILFQLERNAENLNQIAQDIEHKRIQADQVSKKFSALLNSNHEIEQLYWLDKNRKIISSGQENLARNPTELAIETVNPLDKPANTGKLECFLSAPQAKAKAEAEAKSRQTSDKQQGSNLKGLPRTSLLNCQIPIFSQQQVQGFVLISYLPQTILEQMVPWWFAQENEISLIDINEKILADRAAAGPGRNIYSHNRSLELPGLSLILRTSSIKTEPKLFSNFLAISVILLSIGLIWSLIALWRDILRRLAAEGALRQQVSFRSAMENSLMTGLRARDMQGKLTYVNPAFCKMVGYPEDQLLGRLPPLPYWAPEVFDEYHQRFNQLLSGNITSQGFETIYQRASGERFPVLIYESALVNEHGVQTGWMSSILDTSELKNAQNLARLQQEKLHTSARLATMGEIASMLAHELNQPLAAISSYTSGAINLLKSGYYDPNLVQNALEKANTQTLRAGHIIRSVHEFVKKREVHREAVDISDLLYGLMPLLDLQAQSAKVQVHCVIAENLPPVLADKILLEQVILNLSRNAMEAMQDQPQERRLLSINVSISVSVSVSVGNNISVSASAANDISASPEISSCENAAVNSARVPEQELSRQVQQSSKILVQVSDLGSGISEEVAAQLFTPFFSTKSTGMGMGLSICRSAIEFHGGHLDYKPNPAGGSIFQFTLPSSAMPNQL